MACYGCTVYDYGIQQESFSSGEERSPLWFCFPWFISYVLWLLLSGKILVIVVYKYSEISEYFSPTFLMHIHFLIVSSLSRFFMKSSLLSLSDFCLSTEVNVLRMFFNNCFGSGVTLIIFSARYLVLLGVFFISVIRSLVICLEPSL